MAGLQLKLRCACGQLRGEVGDVTADNLKMVVCYCDDCQRYAQKLQKSDVVLDEHGGTTIYQVTPAHVTFSQGADQLTCLRLTEKGPLRWYTRCCTTAVANTPPTAQLPFVGLVHTCLDLDSDARQGLHALGTVRHHIQAQYAIGDLGSVKQHPKFPAPLLLRLGAMILAARLRGEHKRSPFFDAQTLQPIATPRRAS